LTLPSIGSFRDVGVVHLAKQRGPAVGLVVDFASTHAGHAYAEFQQYAVADAGRERRDLLEHLLAGKLPSRGPLLAAAQCYGLRADARMLVAAAVPVGPEPDADAPYAASAAIARGGLRELRRLAELRSRVGADRHQRAVPERDLPVEPRQHRQTGNRPNTAQYRLRRNEERTGRNPRQIADLLDLLFAIELDERSVRADP
jgi:PucR C-terminal helix-turn-helix domain